MNIPLKMSKQRLLKGKDLTEAHSSHGTQSWLNSRGCVLKASATPCTHPAETAPQRIALVGVQSTSDTGASLRANF